MLKLSDIFGQDAAVEAVRRAWERDRLPHGLIFAGPTGVGKGTAAAALAALFLCERPRGVEPCGQCPACTIFAAGNHPDYHIIYRQLIRIEHADRKAIDLSIDVIRNYLIAPANLKPAMNRGKVFIVEEADLMTLPAQNALLKTLEEPAGRTLLVLLTDQPDAMLPTIRSRCQVIRFAGLSPAMVRDELVRRNVPRPTAENAARLAEGSLGLALRWIADGVIAEAAELESRLAAMLAGRTPPDLAESFRAAAEKYSAAQLKRDELSSKEQATRQGLVLYLRLAGSYLRRQLAAEEDPARLDRVCRAIEALAQSEQYLDANVNVALIFQQLAVTLEGLFQGGTVGVVTG